MCVIFMTSCGVNCVESFRELIPKLGDRLLHSDHVSVDNYWDIISKADVVVSTAQHEFFGVAMYVYNVEACFDVILFPRMEASYAGCYPLCPNQLVYPELYPSMCGSLSETVLTVSDHRGMPV